MLFNHKNRVLVNGLSSHHIKAQRFASANINIIDSICIHYEPVLASYLLGLPKLTINQSNS